MSVLTSKIIGETYGKLNQWEKNDRIKNSEVLDHSFFPVFCFQIAVPLYNKFIKPCFFSKDF